MFVESEDDSLSSSQHQTEIELKEYHAPSTFSTTAQIEARLQAESLLARAKLSSLEKQIYLAKSALYDLTFDEIASRLKKSSSTVKTSFYRAETKIKKII